MKFVFILAILIFLLYIYYNPIYNKVEGFENEIKTLNANHVYRENQDLNYMNKRTGDKITMEENVQTQRIAPINNPSLGIDAYNPLNAVAIANKIPNSRVPAKGSTEKEYNIPMPKFDDLVDNPITFTAKKSKIKNIKPIPKPSSPKPIINKSITNSKYCKFISSYGTKDFTCPKDYPVHTGAKFGITGSVVSCNGEDVSMDRAKAIASIKNGTLKNIIVTSAGSNYEDDSTPSVRIRGGGGRGAEAYAQVKNTKISKIIITNPGTGYKSTPNVRIAKPNAVGNCNLCCRTEL